MSGKLAYPPGLPTASVIIAAFTMRRWDDLREAVASVRAQTAPTLETVVVIDHCPDLLALAGRELSGVTVVPNAGCRGAGRARNSGVASSRGEVVAFLDDDAFASSAWLENLVRHFAKPQVVGVGGQLDPLWADTRPRWFPPEFDWAVGASYRGMPDTAAPVRNVWSGNMAIRRRVFDAIGGFRDDFGKLGERSRPEDTDLRLRAAKALDQGTWIYEPAAAATHRVPPQRAHLGFFLRRCLNEGSGKAALAALNGAGESTSAERRYTRQVLPGGSPAACGRRPAVMPQEAYAPSPPGSRWRRRASWRAGPREPPVAAASGCHRGPPPVAAASGCHRGPPSPGRPGRTESRQARQDGEEVARNANSR